MIVLSAHSALSALFPGIIALIADINPGGANSLPRDFAVFNNKLYFRTDDGLYGEELWVCDGVSDPKMV